MILQIQPWIDQSEMEQLIRVVDSTFVTEGELTAEFEGLTKRLTSAKHAISMTNGTVALYCCLKALNIGPGDEVIVPNMTFIATSNAVIMAGATPIFCDIYPDTFCIDVEAAEKLISDRTKAIIPVHLYGQSADLDKILQLATKYKIRVVEDAAQGVGVKFNNKHVGTFGDLGILSYYGNKTITCGEGGMILTNNDELARACYMLKNHGRDRKGVFIHESIGFNFAFTEMQAAIGISQMNKLPKIISRKNEIYKNYLNGLRDVPGVLFPILDSRCTPVHWFTSILVKDSEWLGQELAKYDIQTRRFFYPLNKQPCYASNYSNNRNYFVSENIYKQGLSLPSSYQLTNEEQDTVIDVIKCVMKDLK